MKSKEIIKDSKTGLTRERCDKKIQVVRSKRKGIDKGSKRKERKNIFTVLHQHGSKHIIKSLEDELSSASERSISNHHKDYGRTISRPRKSQGSCNSNPRSSEENVVDYEYNRMFLVRHKKEESKKLKKNFRSFSDRNLVHKTMRTESNNRGIADYVTVMQEAEAEPGELPPEGSAPEAGSDESKRMSQSESNIANGDRKSGGCGAKCCPKNKNRKPGITPKCWMGLEDGDEENVSCPRCSQVWQRGRSERQSRDGGGGCKCSQSRSRGGFSSRGRRRSSGRISKQRGSCACSSKNDRGFGNLPDTSCISTYHNKATNFIGYKNPGVDYEQFDSTCELGKQIDHCKECGMTMDTCQCRKARHNSSKYSVYSITNNDIFGSKKCLKCRQLVNNCQCTSARGSGTDEICGQETKCCPTCELSKDECNELRRTQTLPSNENRCDCKQRLLKKRLMLAVNICPKCRLPREDCICLEELLLNFKQGVPKKKCECVCKRPGQDGQDSLDKLLQEAYNTCPKCGRTKNQCICLEELLMDIKQTINRQARQLAMSSAGSGGKCKNRSIKCPNKNEDNVMCSHCKMPKVACGELIAMSDLKDNSGKCICKKIKKSLSKQSLTKKDSRGSINECGNSNIFHIQVQNSENAMSKRGSDALWKQSNENGAHGKVNASTECPHCHKSESKCECKKPSTSCKECKMPKLMCQCNSPIKNSPTSNALGIHEKQPKHVKKPKKNNYCDCSNDNIDQIRKANICEVCLRPENNCVCKKENTACQKCGKRKADGKRHQHSENRSRREGGSERSRSTANRRNVCEIRKVTHCDTKYNHFGCQPSEDFLMRVCNSPNYLCRRVDSRETKRHKTLRQPSYDSLDRSLSNEQNEHITSTSHLDSNQDDRRSTNRNNLSRSPDLCSECCAHSERSYRSKEVRRVSPSHASKIKYSTCNQCTFEVEKRAETDIRDAECSGSPTRFQRLRSHLQHCTGCGKKHKKRQFQNTLTQCNCADGFDVTHRKTVEDGDKTSENKEGKVSVNGQAYSMQTAGDNQMDSHNTVITKQFNEIVKVLLPPKVQHSTESVEEYGQAMKD